MDLSIEQFAPICDTTDRFPIAASAAARYGLNETVEIMCGASDGCLAAYAGYVSTGIKNSLTIGTSAAVRKVTDQPVFDQRQNFCYYLKEGQYVIGAPSNNGGASLLGSKKRWHKILTLSMKVSQESLKKPQSAAMVCAFSVYQWGTGSLLDI